MSKTPNTDFLDQESDAGFLRMYSKVLYRDLLEAQAEIKELRALKEKAEQLELKLKSEYSILRQDYFGHGREKLSNKNEDRVRSEGDQEILLHAKSLVPAPKNKDTKRLPQQTVRHTASDAELDRLLREREPELSKDFKADWQEMASFVEQSRIVTIIERKFIEVIHERQKYKTIITNPATGEEKEVIYAAPGVERLLPGCSYGIELAVAIVADKYLMHLPLERQRRAMESQGLKNVSVKTLWNLCWAVGEHLRPIANSIRVDVLGNNLCVHADETPWPIQGEENSDGYLWSISNMAGSYYQFEPTRSGKVIVEMLDGFEGSVMSDGFSGYNRLKVNPKIELSHCWAHVRRKFFQLYESSPEETRAKEMVELMDDLFAIERKARDFEELKYLRQKESVLLIEKIKTWLDDEIGRCLPQSGMRKAINYTVDLWPGLTIFLVDIRVPLSNNDAERTLRHAVVGRKNYYGSKSIDGADLAATLFTVIESCKRVELEPRAFIEMAVRASARGENPPTPLEYAKTIRPAAPTAQA